jgi:hypothetical protein
MARAIFFSRAPYIDACGFESYRYECEECGVLLAGIKRSVYLFMNDVLVKSAKLRNEVRSRL